ncbi:hypothetical protein CWI38_0543p0020 [Hamiltosporidium tvaerminnensis]|uniref:Uncharacterized protein n=1 Tax=Hamiltosporidium tvaerminnensis TaxID=1176355 RepID=A0A4Q9LWE1_9MICR|nr:hypothetical protein CWI38_0543p0020 [Hamiltosporidium tvaerminnensis]
MASESINTCTQPPNIYAGGIPEQNHMENPSVPTPTYIVSNKDNDVVFEINNHEIFKVIISLCRKDEIRRLEYFYPLLDHDYTISFQNILDCRKKINNITETIKTLVEKILANRKYEIGFMCYLMKIFRLKAPFIFHARNRPMIYCKPLFLLLPLWIENTIQNELTLAKHLFNISLILNVTKAIMKYNYKCLKPFIDQNIRENKQVGFSYHFSSQKSLIYNHFNLIIKFFEDIFIILGGEAYYKIFKCATDSEFLVNNCNNVFSFTLAHFEITAILFDVLKTSQENKDLKFKSYIKKTLNEESYLQNENSMVGHENPYSLDNPKGNRLSALLTICDSVKTDQNEWPQIVFFVVQTWFERMSRNAGHSFKEFIDLIGLEINKEKSATNDTCCQYTATILELDDAVRAVLAYIVLKISTRRAAILKYRLVEAKAQLAKPYNEIEKQKLHSKLYTARKNELVSVSDSSRWLKRGNIRPRDEAVFCYIQDRNIFCEGDCVCQHRGKYKFKFLKRIRSHSVQEILDNDYAEIRVNIGIKTDVKIRKIRPDIFILDKEKNSITFIRMESLSKLLGYVEIIPYVMIWDGIVRKYHKSDLKRLEIHMNVEAYIQSIVLKKTVETISFDRRRELEPVYKVYRAWKMRQCEPIHPLKQARNDENGDKEIKTKDHTPLISKGETGHKHKSRVGFRRRDGCSKRSRRKYMKMIKKVLTQNFIK